MNTIRKTHHGRNVKRWREMLGIKQEILAENIGFSQTTLSRLEGQETIEDEVLEKIAKELNTTIDVLKNFDEERAINIVSNTFQDESTGSCSYITHYKCTFNPLDKVVELYEQQIELYKQILKEKTELLEKFMQEKN
ncbi:transcriptional regulator [Bacteroidia bacterium]|nr:transcriptional regulator [Bacteroidia bacterium]